MINSLISHEELEYVTRGSYEEKMQRLSDAIAESPLFSEGTSLVSTFSDHVVLFLEGTGLVTCDYKEEDGDIKLSIREDVTHCAKGALESMDDADALVALAIGSEMQRMDPFSLREDRVWRQYLASEKKDIVSEGVRHYTESLGVIDGVTLTRSLLSVRKNVDNILSDISFVMEKYEPSTKERTVEEASVLVDFDASLSDFIAELEECLVHLDGAIDASRSGMAKRAAKIHNVIAEDLNNLHFGCQWYTRVISDLVTV